MSIVFLVGNGFNYLAEDIIRNPNGQETPEQLVEKKLTADSVNSITALWRRFDEVFQELNDQFRARGIRISHEELIRMIYTVINLFSSMKGFEKILSPEDIERIKSAFSGFLLEKIREIAKDFQEHQDNAYYGKIRNYFPNLPINVQAFISERGLGKVRVFTTNYDGVFDTIFTNRPYGFIFSDGFTTSAEYDDLLEIEPAYLLNNDLVIGHIHGSYRFTKKYGKTYKTKQNSENGEPVMVFNNPDMKEEIVSGDNVLSEYYKHLCVKLSRYNKLVIFGNSMEAEPHIKKAIQKYFNRPGTSILICSRTTEPIRQQVEEVYNQGEIIEISTRGMNTEEQLISLFDTMLT